MMSTGPGAPLPHGFVVPPHDIVNDDAADPESTTEEADKDEASAEALGYADPEDTPTGDHGGEDQPG
ncbi:hypothetical protein [Brachybacterium massiliense]|uniref:hypothetical protein n=1 Tax=Brachybacterium massiliense TaxID=1755098 RepID=UPI000B3BC2BA|nr:hypothetical protein [Brachybacterium massiliense]